MADTPLINGIRHSWGDIKLNLLGRTVSGITAIAYDDKTEKKNGYGAGNMPTDRGYGNYEATAKITLKRYEVQAIQTALAGKRLQDIAPFDITVAYLNAADKIVTDVIRNVEFTNNKRDVKQADSDMVVELDLIVSHIEWGV